MKKFISGLKQSNSKTKKPQLDLTEGDYDSSNVTPYSDYSNSEAQPPSSSSAGGNRSSGGYAYAGAGAPTDAQEFTHSQMWSGGGGAGGGAGMNQGYPPPSQGYPPPSQGYPPPSQAYGQYAPPPGPPPGAVGGGFGAAGTAGTAAGLASMGNENEFAQLKRFDTVILVDDSESMEMFWDETREALVGVVEIAARYDTDGIDLAFFNSQLQFNGIRSRQEVQRIFQKVEPRRSTPTRDALQRILGPYMMELESQRAGGGGAGRKKPLNVICLTDGAPNRDQNPEDLIVDTARKLDAGRYPPFQIGISFIQIGNDDEATVALNRLDDDLKAQHGIRDIVDVTPSQVNQREITTEWLLKALLGGINRKMDKQALGAGK